MTDVYNKRDGMECYKDNLRTFPHRDSLLPYSTKLNVVTSQFIRFGRRISTMTAFLRASSNLVARMIYSGYEGDRVYKKVDDFQRYWFKYCAHLGRWRDFKAAFGSCVRRRIDELVGNLLNDVHAAT